MYVQRYDVLGIASPPDLSVLETCILHLVNARQIMSFFLIRHMFCLWWFASGLSH